MIDLSSVNTKIHRGDEHLQLLNHEIATWKESEPYTVLKEANFERTEYTLGVRFNDWPDLHRWAGIAGDAIHNYRSVLDHLTRPIADHLGVAVGSGENLYWPICDSKANFDRALNRIGGIRKNEALVRAIESTQPFSGGDHDDFLILRRLRDLDNPDKHEAVQLSSFGLHSVAAKLTGADPDSYVKLTINEGPLEREAPLMWLSFEKPQREVVMDLNFSIRIAFAKGARQVSTRGVVCRCGGHR